MSPFSSVSTTPKYQPSILENKESPELTAINAQLKRAGRYADQGCPHITHEICFAIIQDTVQLQRSRQHPDEVKRIYTNLREIAKSDHFGVVDNELKDRALEFELETDFDNAKVIYQVIVDKPSNYGPDAEAEHRLKWLEEPESFDAKQELADMRNASGKNRKVAEYYLGKIYQSGAYGLPVDSVSYSSEKSRSGDHEASADLEKAAFHLDLSAKQGYQPACQLLEVVLSWMSDYQLGVFHEKRGGGDDDTKRKEALKYYQKAAEKNDPKALYRLARVNIYIDRLYGGNQNESKAIDYLTRAVEQKHPESARLLGDIYWKKIESDFFWNVEENTTKALSYYKCAIQWGLSDFKPLYVEYLKEAAEKDNAYAMCELGKACIEGNLELGIPKDVAKGKEWLEKAVKKGHVEACYAFAVYCEKAVITPRFASNVRSEFFYYSQAIDKNPENSNLCPSERPIYKQLAKAIELYLFAAEKGHEDAYPSMISLQLQLVETMHAAGKKTTIKQVQHPISREQHLNNLCRFGEILVTTENYLLRERRELGETQLREAADQGHSKAALLLAGVLEKKYHDELKSITGYFSAGKYCEEQIHYLEIAATGEGEIAEKAKSKLDSLKPNSINSTTPKNTTITSAIDHHELL